MCLNMTEEKGFTNLDECELRFEETDYQTPVINYPIYPHRSNLFLPIYYPQSWYYPDRLVDLSYHERPYGESTRSFQLVQNRNDEIERPLLEKKNPLFLDDIRSAALALTSLSLASPASNLPSVDDHSKARSADSAFIFPPKNTPTEEGQHFANSRVTTTYSDYMHGNISRLTTSPRSFDEAKRHGLTAECISRSPRISESKEYERDNSETRYGKPRSYSHRDFNKELTQPVPIISKPRSYSFDAVGRANKHIYGSDHTHDNVIGYQSAPHSHSQMIQGRLGRCSVDEGIGSSSGSADSVEHAPTKRKLPSRTIFRCMWRGCDKELNTLSGIILHVRHAHIGPSKAGEEEFYFDDVNVDSTTTSGISSSEESLSEECSKSKYRKSITEDDLFEKIKEEENLENNVFECDYGPSLNKKESLNDSPVIRTTESEPGYVKITELRPVCTLNEKQGPSLCPLTMLAATHQLDSSSQNNSTSVLSNKTTARHLDSPVFNINFTDNLPTSELNTTSTRIFIPTEGMHRVRGKGRKKCRKVYGMSNKKLWCTQCRWKKACVRFT